MRARALLVVLIAGCSNDGLPVAGDGGNGAPDLVSATTCASLTKAVTALLAASTACSTDGDCVREGTPCGLPGVCGVYVNVAATAQLDGLDAQYAAMKCGAGLPCPSCPAIPPAACNGGMCGPRNGSSPVGASCSGIFDCAGVDQYQGLCLSEPAFPGGECALPCAHGFGCPAPGMLCEPVTATGNATACFKQCTADSDCRVAEGYRCCPGWGTAGLAGSVCYPAPCPPPRM